jgi:hypothetical protein
MPKETPEQRIRRRVHLLEAVLDAQRLLSGFAKGMLDWDRTLAGRIKRKRGDRTKLQGGVFVEEAAVDAVRVLKDRFKESGETTEDAWVSARQIVGNILGVSPFTIGDWGRGATRRKRKKAKG